MSNAAKTLQFEDLAVFKKHVFAIGKNLKLVHEVVWINVKKIYY